MTAQARVYIPVTTAEYAKLWGLTSRQARARIQHIPGAVKVGSRWQAPILATDYAKRKGIRVASARKRKAAIRATNPKDIGAILLGKDKAKLEAAAAAKLTTIVGHTNRFNPNTVAERMTHADRPQLAKIANWKPSDWEPDLYLSDDWLGDDDFSILYYH